MKYNRIRELREDKDFTQKQIAKYLNIAERTYSGYENGTCNMPLYIIVELAYYYETSVDYLLNVTDESKPYKRKK